MTKCLWVLVWWPFKEQVFLLQLFSLLYIVSGTFASRARPAGELRSPTRLCRKDNYAPQDRKNRVSDKKNSQDYLFLH